MVGYKHMRIIPLSQASVNEEVVKYVDALKKLQDVSLSGENSNRLLQEGNIRALVKANKDAQAIINLAQVAINANVEARLTAGGL